MGRRVVRRKGRKEEERRGSEGVYVSFSVSLRVTTGPENMRGVEVGWARNGLVGRWRGRRGKGPETCTVVLHRRRLPSALIGRAHCFARFTPLILSCHVIFRQTRPTQSQSLANVSDIVCLAAGRLRAVAAVFSLARIYHGLSSPGPSLV
jgi:hypothetical protein